MKIKILFSDNIHFHKRGFKSLFYFIDKYKIKHHFISHEDTKLLSRYGNYSSYKSKFLDNYTFLDTLNSGDLYMFKYNALSIYKLSKAEILSYTMTLPNWYNHKIPYDDKIVFEKLYKENKEILLLNMAIAMYWVDFWIDFLKNNEKYTHCCIFSGSLIYQKTLIEISKNTPMKIMIFEHFFTGNDYYCEHKYDHIANNSDIRFQNYYKNILDVESMNKITFENEKIKSINKIINANNKNVKQPIDESNIKLFDNDNKTILILGQVINDFSIIETKLDNIVSLEFYKELIIKIVKETTFNIIFKAHPWEREKANLKSSLTYNELIKYIIKNDCKDRVKLVENYNLNSLFEQSNLVTTLCSQGALEAAFVGKKVVQLGNAFYGKKGFTYDYNSIDKFIYEIKNLKGTLSLDEYKQYELFLFKILQSHLVSIYPSGIKSLELKFNKINIVKTIVNNQKLNNLKQDYENSSIKILAQRIKKIPLLGKSLLWFKHNVLKWDR